MQIADSVGRRDYHGLAGADNTNGHSHGAPALRPGVHPRRPISRTPGLTHDPNPSTRPSPSTRALAEGARLNGDLLSVHRDSAVPQAGEELSAHPELLLSLDNGPPWAAGGRHCCMFPYVARVTPSVPRELRYAARSSPTTDLQSD